MKNDRDQLSAANRVLLSVTRNIRDAAMVLALRGSMTAADRLLDGALALAGFIESAEKTDAEENMDYYKRFIHGLSEEFEG